MTRGIAIFSGTIVTFAIAFYLVLYWNNQRHPEGSQTSTTPVVDGISCDTVEHTQVRLHTHLYILDNGKHITIPAEIGIENNARCLYWIHTHDTTGVIHVEAPVQRKFTLGKFLDIWKLYPKEIFGKQVKVYVNSQLYNGNLRSLPLKNQENIVIEIGPKYVSPPSYHIPANMA